MQKLSTLAFLLVLQSLNAQQSYPDSLLRALPNAVNDSVRHEIYSKLSGYYFSRDRIKMFNYSGEAIKIARSNGMMLDVAKGLDNKGYFLNKENRYGEAFKCYIEGIRLAEDPANEKRSWSKWTNEAPYQYRMEILAGLHHDLGHVYWSTGNNREAIHQFRKCLNYLEKALPTSYNSALMNIGAVYLGMNNLDSALHYQRKELAGNAPGYRSIVFKYIGDIHFRKGNIDSAFYYYHQGLGFARGRKAFSQEIINLLGLARWHLAEENKDSSLFYANRFLTGIQQLQGNPVKDINISTAYEILYQTYQLQGQQDSTLKYLQLAFLARDSISRQKIQNLTQYQNLTFQEQLRLEELEDEKLQTRNRIRIYSLLAGLFVIVLVAGGFYRQSRQKQKANKILQAAYTKLKATQSQLVHAEKMASLGELTAGIAHEIQNPLNFVNNFSELSTELATEMKEELAIGNRPLAEEIANDIIINLEKIHHHGKRADGIVKGMLQHSRSGNGRKEPTDINVLADEYLRLSYHGLRAKDKSFNADFKMKADKNLPKIDVVPQDFGRVLLNLINNAFFAVSEKKKTASKEYKPSVSVSTKRMNNVAEIRVKDNGNGIPESIKEKIFQPFFTTKPTGEGTGLGLSLSYDIITKGHGGQISVETKENQGTEFIIQLPLKTKFNIDE